MPNRDLYTYTTTANNYIWPQWTNTSSIRYLTETNIWQDWNQVYQVRARWNDGTESTGYLNADTWHQWTTNSITLNDYNNDVWGGWITTGGTGNIGARIAPTLQTPYRDRVGAGLVRTEEEWAAIRAENERLRAERDKLSAAARAEARKLLEIVLSKAQLASYDKHGYFDVVGSHGTLYRLRHGVSGNITQFVDGKEVAVLCVHPSLYDAERKGYLPTEDSLVAQVLALKTDETEVVKTANVHRGRRHLAVVDGLRVA